MQDKEGTPRRNASLTLADVARLANVSEITVSRVIRDKQPIAPHTREKVMQAIADLGYVPNRIAGTLASVSSKLVGVVLPSLSNIVFAEVYRGIQDTLEPLGFQSIVGVTNYSENAEERLVSSLLSWKPAAMMIAGQDHTPTTRRMLEAASIPIAELMSVDAAPIDLAVGMSNIAAGRDIVRHLWDAGYRRFGYIGHDIKADHRAGIRFEAMKDELGVRGSTFIATVLTPSSSSVAEGRSSLERLLAESPSVEVVVFSNDDMAIGGVFHCMANGIRPKQDIGLFGFNGLEIGQSLPHKLSTVHSKRFDIGRIAVQRLLAADAPSSESRMIDIGYTIIHGETA